jgi:glycosyltransferase involved in cell wall biosynthesis
MHVFPSFEAAGSQLRFLAMSKEWGTEFEHSVVSLSGNYQASSRVTEGVSIEIVKMDFPKGSTAKLIKPILKTVSLVKPNIILTYNWGAIEWAMCSPLHRVPVIHVEDGFGPEEVKRRLRRRNWTRRLVFRFATEKVIVISNGLHKIAKDEWHTPTNKLHFINNGVNLNKFLPKNERTTTNKFESKDKLIIGTVCGLRPEKRVSRLLEAVAIASSAVAIPIELHIAGDGIERTNLEKMAADFSNKFITVFLGSIPNPEAALSTFDVFALSSDTEQAPLGVLEAMASGLPIASVDVGDVKTMVCAENRPLVSGQDDVSLANSLATLLRSPELRAQLGRGNRAECEARHSFAQSATNWKLVLSTIPKR